jgi:SAM-dependent methyltransferase
VKRRLLRLLARAGLLGPAFRTYERVVSLRPGKTAPADGGPPLPPRRLMVRVAGTADAEWFLRSGRAAYDAIVAHVPLQGNESILDFGCGCGRVTRYWADFNGSVAGSDVSLKAVDWCRENLGFASFLHNGLAPGLDTGDNEFDLVYALSVFTHLPEELQLAWARELERVVKPGGFLLLTVHGQRYRDRLTEAERSHFDAGRLVVRWEEGAGSNLCSAFHPPSYVKERLAAPFELVEFVPEGATGNPHQDLYLLTRP